VDLSRFGNIKDATAKARAVGGWYGEFIESGFFGIEKNTNPMADIMAIETEIKAHSGATAILNIGGVSVYGITAAEKSSDAVKNLVVLYKMATKMQNFLLLKIEPISEGSRMHMGFEEISLHMFLILKKLYDMIYNKLRSGGVVWSESGTWNPATMTKAFQVKMSLSKINEVYGFIQLYLEHLDLLSRIKSSSADRAGFWRSIKDLKLASFGGKTPQFSLTIL